MRIVYIDSGSSTEQNVRAFSEALNLAPIKRIAYEFKTRAIEELAAPGDCVAIVVAHGQVEATELRRLLREEAALKAISVIRIGISVGAPRLVVAERFDDRVAAFEWPIKAGAGLQDLGANIVQLNSSLEERSAETLLELVKVFFKAKFEADALIAAYLLRVHLQDAEYAERLERLQMSSFQGMTKDQLKDALKDRIVEIS